MRAVVDHGAGGQAAAAGVPGGRIVRAPTLLVLLAVCCVLLPAHPSLQGVLRAFGIPAALVSLACAFLPLLFAATQPVYAGPRRAVLGLFLAYVVLMGMSAVTSEAFGEAGHLASLRGLLVLLPLSVAAALVAATRPALAMRAIVLLGLVAALHFGWLLVTGDPQDGAPGFRALYSEAERENYQSTSFYLGFLAVAGLAALRARGGRARLAAGCVALAGVALMASVGARASLVAVLAAGLALALPERGERLGAVRLLALLVGVPVLLFAFPGGAVMDFLAERFSAFGRFSVLLAEDDSSGRVWLFSSAVQMWLQSPWTFAAGAGLGSFPRFIGMTEAGWYPHNFVLETLAEGGLLPAAVLLLIGRQVLARLAAARARGDASLRLPGALAVYAIAAYQFMGGIQTLWIPAFFVALHLLMAAERT